MTIFEQLANNKGTTSSALGKALSLEVLDRGRLDILAECIDLASYQASSAAAKNIRAGAAKVVEAVAEARPELVAPHLAALRPALSVQEPQTRWMIIRVMGFCTHLNAPVAREAIAYAEKYIDNKDGLIIASSADLFLGDLGAVSKEDAQRVFPLLEKSMAHLYENEADWILEAFLRVFGNLERAEQDKALAFAERWLRDSKKSTHQRAKKLIKLGKARAAAKAAHK